MRGIQRKVVVEMAVLYDDGKIVVDDEGITLRRYYFPIATGKRIPYERIQGVTVRPMGWLRGKGRVWGSARPRYWLPLDLSRPKKDTLVVLDLGRFVRPAFSPDDPSRVADLLGDHVKTPAGGRGAPVGL